jgi:hypothetical protein
MLNFSGFFDDSHVDVTPSKQPRSDMLFDSFETQPINKTLFDVKPLLCANDVPDDVQREITRRVREELWAIVQQEIEKIRHETAEQIEKIRKEMLSQNNLDIERRVTEQVEEILARERQKMEAEYKQNVEILCTRAVKETENRLRKEFELQISQIQHDIQKRFEFSAKSLGGNVPDRSNKEQEEAPKNSKNLLHTTLATEFNAQDFAKQLIQQAKLGQFTEQKPVIQPVPPAYPPQQQQYEQYQDQFYTQPAEQYAPMYQTQAYNYQQMYQPQAQYADNDQELDEEHIEQDLASVKKSNPVKKAQLQKVRFQKENTSPVDVNSNKENEVVVSGNRYQELISQVKKPVVKKNKPTMMANNTNGEDELSRSEGRIERWRKSEREHGEKFREQQAILEECLNGSGELGLVISHVKGLLNWVRLIEYRS